MNSALIFFLHFIVFFLGLTIGSFLNCLIYRLPERKNIFGYSYCPRCFHSLSFLDLIPVFSFLFLKGRCRYCKAKISWQYPLVELVTGFLFFLSFLDLTSKNYPSNIFLIFLIRNWVFISVMIFVFVYDLKYTVIEDIVIVPSIIIIFFLNLLAKIPFSSIFLGGILSYLFFLVQYILTKKKGLGEGDLRLGILIGIMFGWPKFLVALFTSYFIGGIISFLLLITKKKKLSSKIPLGPFLSLGSFFTLFFEKIF